MECNMQVLVILSCVLIQLVVSLPAELDKTPYEFGFNIGSQHREEKKDANGIVTGEYGFETADGYYNVVQYATDEEGNFRILNRQRIRLPPREVPAQDTGASGAGGKAGEVTEETAPPPPPPTTTTTTTTTTTERVKIYQFNYTAPWHGRQEMGFSDTSKMGEYYWDGPDGYRRIVTYNADDEGGYRPVVKQIQLPPDQVPTE